MSTMTITAADLGREHGRQGSAPFGDLDDAGSGDLMTVLGEAGETTDGNFGERLAMLDAYRDAWESAAGRFYPAGDGETCDECGTLIPDSEQDMVNGRHMPSCSLYPASVV